MLGEAGLQLRSLVLPLLHHTIILPYLPLFGFVGVCLPLVLQVCLFEQQCQCLVPLHRHLVTPLGLVEPPRDATPPVELRPPLEAIDADAVTQEVGHMRRVR